ncbi:MAG: 3-hydroxybutyrate dehydrogenase [Xenococcaceae cyanobacterium MO_207.B15]|nr:3-hydroxybutyrate dehydrogenase [Xenococcaceae cyanobacterium MO_207.B15]
MNLKGKAAIVTGSTSGIGEKLASALAEQGVNIMLNGFGNAISIEEQRLKLEKQFGVKAVYSGADMSKPEEIRAMAAKAFHEFGQVDILINNAGIQHVEPITQFPEAKWDAIVAVNLSSNFHTIKAIAPKMKTNGWGRIINISSVHGLVASPYKSAYVAAKHGVIGLTKVVALELAEFGITCNAICPGSVNTPLMKRQLPELAKAYNISEEDAIKNVLLKNHAIKKQVSVSDLAALTLFLCSDAAQMITGSSISIDGGWTAQ